MSYNLHYRNHNQLYRLKKHQANQWERNIYGSAKWKAYQEF
jgi:hypothetical protein